MPGKVWFLRRLNLFEGMSEAEIEEIAQELKMRTCAPRRSVLSDSGDRVYLLKQGRLYHLTLEGQEVTTAVVSPGQLFGLGAFLGVDGGATHAEAMEESHICEAGAQDFLADRYHPRIRVSHIEHVASGASDHDEGLANRRTEARESSPCSQSRRFLL